MTDTTSRLIARTRRRLFLVTFGLVALLVVGIGAATAIVTLRALDADLDRALASSVDATARALHDGLPSGGGGSDDTEDAVLAASDTFLLILDEKGNVLANPSRVPLVGLPDEAAVKAASVNGRDLRTVEAAGVDMRLLTVPIETESDGGKTVGYVQGGFILVLHDQQSRSIVAAILLVAVVGLIGAAIVTLLVTGWALVPIRRSFEAQRRFVADASHELRTPAALIRSNADVMEREGLAAEDGKPLVADIITEADRLARLVADLLQLATTESTGLVIERHPVDLGAIATDTIREVGALAAERSVTLVGEDTAGGPTIVSGDRDRIIQLVLILLDNAFDHSPPGGIVTVGVRRVDRMVALAVTDEGPGIPLAERERVFEPFMRLPGVRRDNSSGTGLGLAIARRIVTAHGGSIRIDDGPAGGARFVVEIPADDARTT